MARVTQRPAPGLGFQPGECTREHVSPSETSQHHLAPPEIPPSHSVSSKQKLALWPSATLVPLRFSRS